MDRNHQRHDKEHSGREKRPRSETSSSSSRHTEKYQRSSDDVVIPDLSYNQGPPRRTALSIPDLLNPDVNRQQLLRSPQPQAGHFPNTSGSGSQSTGHARKRSRVLGNEADLVAEALLELSGIPGASGAGASSGMASRSGTVVGSVEVNRQSLEAGASRGAAESREFCCDTCGSQFARLDHLERHKATHNETRPRLPCGQCDKTFLSEEGLSRHMNLHDPECKFACNLCGKKFSGKYHLDHHMLTHDPQNRPRFTCSECGKTFTKTWNLTYHKNNNCRRQ